MVSLAIAETLSETSSETSSPLLNDQPNKTISLRDSALWFPSIPESHLQLNETNFKGMHTAASGFRPLCCLFGDITNPIVLSKILVTSGCRGALAIDCYYNTGNVGRLGSYCPPEAKTAGFLVMRTTREDKDAITFVRNRELRPPNVRIILSVLILMIQRIIYLYLIVPSSTTGKKYYSERCFKAALPTQSTSDSFWV
jgi:hypothetical protein